MVPVPREGCELGYLNAGSLLPCPKRATAKIHCHRGDGGAKTPVPSLPRDARRPLTEPNSQGVLPGPGGPRPRP